MMLLVFKRIAIQCLFLIYILIIVTIMYILQLKYLRLGFFFKTSDITVVTPHWKSSYWCKVKCISGVPCEYMDEVDFRIILLVFNRATSLIKSLEHIGQIKMQQDKLSVDIWIDVYTNGTVCDKIIQVIKDFNKIFHNGRICYHIQSQHSFIANQWIYSYRPKINTKEVAMILEDDIDVSAYVWKWYKALHQHFYLSKNIAGYSLKMQGTNLRAVGMTHIPIKGPNNHTIVLYNCFQAWGYSPQPHVWRQFQDWYSTIRPAVSENDIVNRIDTIDPYVEKSLHYNWYIRAKRRHFHDSLAHDMWNIYFTNYKITAYTVYSNLNEFTGRKNVRLCDHRAENGLHYKGAGRTNTDEYLLNFWNESFIYFPAEPFKLSITGNREI